MGRGMNGLQRGLWLGQYYLYNAAFSKIGSRLKATSMGRARDAWESIRRHFPRGGEVLVVGNGPSLRGADLTALKDIPSIASNRIDLIFPQTTWRPTLYTICDPLLAYKLRNSTFEEVDTVLCSHQIYYMLRKAQHKVGWRNIPFAVAQTRMNDFVPDPVKGMFEGFTVTIQNIQLAVWLGAKHIYLIGCDHFYQEEQHDNAGKKLAHEGSNHFHPEYRKKGEIVNNAPVKRMNEAYRLTKSLATQWGVPITNISRRTALDVFERVDFDSFVAQRLARVHDVT